MTDSGPGSQLPEQKRPDEPKPPSQPAKRQVLSVEHHYQQVTVQGPFPPPELLAGYKKVGIDPQKLLDMVQAQAQHRADFERDLLRMEDGDRIEKNRTVRRGQTLGFALGVMAIIATMVGFFVAPEQASAVATVIGPTGLTAFVVALLGVRWINKKQVNADHDNEVVKLRGEVERIKHMLQSGPPA